MPNPFSGANTKKTLSVILEVLKRCRDTLLSSRKVRCGSVLGTAGSRPLTADQARAETPAQLRRGRENEGERAFSAQTVPMACATHGL